MAARTALAHAALKNGANVAGDQLTALGQAKLAYVQTALDLCRMKPTETVVFDEAEKQQSQILLGRMEQYFLYTAKGRTRSRLIIRKPLFVHSDLTRMIQKMADLVAYIVSWAFD